MTTGFFLMSSTAPELSSLRVVSMEVKIDAMAAGCALVARHGGETREAAAVARRSTRAGGGAPGAGQRGLGAAPV